MNPHNMGFYFCVHVRAHGMEECESCSGMAQCRCKAASSNTLNGIAIRFRLVAAARNQDSLLGLTTGSSTI